MTTIYFVRHAQPNYENHDDMSRELSEKGLRDRALVTDFLRDRKVEVVLSSPFKRAYKLSDGESLGEVQRRNIQALNKVLEEYAGKSIAIGSHGTALSTIINYYDKSFGHDEFEKIRGLMPWVVEFSFDGDKCIGIQKHNLFEREKVCT